MLAHLTRPGLGRNCQHNPNKPGTCVILRCRVPLWMIAPLVSPCF